MNSSDDDFMDQLRKAIDATDAYFGFDPYRRRQDRGSLLQGDGAGRHCKDDRIQPLWLQPAEEDVYLWPAGPRSNDPDSELWLRLDPIGAGC